MSLGSSISAQEKLGINLLTLGAAAALSAMAYALVAGWYYFNGDYVLVVFISGSIFLPCIIARGAYLYHHKVSLPISAVLSILDAVSALGVVAIILWFGVFPFIRPVNYYGVYYLFYLPELPINFLSLIFVWSLFIALRVAVQFTVLRVVKELPMAVREPAPASQTQVPLRPTPTGPPGAEDPAALREALLLFRISDMVNELKSLREEINSRGMSYNMPAASGSAPRYSVVSSSKSEKAPGAAGTMVVTPKVELIEQETGKLPDAAGDNPWSSVLSARKAKKPNPKPEA